MNVHLISRVFLALFQAAPVKYLDCLIKAPEGPARVAEWLAHSAHWGAMCKGD